MAYLPSQATQKCQAQSDAHNGISTNIVPATIVDRVRRRLAALGLDPATTSRMAGFAPTFVRDLLQGRKHSVRGSAALKLARVLQTSVEWLLEGRGAEEVSTEQAEFDRVIALLRRVASEDLPQAERALRGFVREESAAFTPPPSPEEPKD